MRAVSKTRAHAHAHPTHVYVIGFSDGIVKVGRTSNPTRRIQQHVRDARARGCEITDQWVGEHHDPRRAEWYLRLVGAQFERISTEYFRADFAVFVAAVVASFAGWNVELPTSLPSERRAS